GREAPSRKVVLSHPSSSTGVTGRCAHCGNCVDTNRLTCGGWAHTGLRAAASVATVTRFAYGLLRLQPGRRRNPPARQGAPGGALVVHGRVHGGDDRRRTDARR